MSARNRYQFRDRQSAEDAHNRGQQELTCHRIALAAILRDEFVWTDLFRATGGAWFQMGLARTSAAHGGIVMVREYYPANLKPSQSAHWADAWIHQMAEYRAGYTPSDAESYAYWACFTALRSLHFRLTRPEEDAALERECAKCAALIHG